MSGRTKRTYSVRTETVRRVRELAERGYASSQDAVVDSAVDRLYREIEAEEEARRWAAAAEDSELRAEIERIALTFDDAGTWPR